MSRLEELIQKLCPEGVESKQEFIYSIQKGDALLTIVGAIGRAAVVKKE